MPHLLLVEDDDVLREATQLGLERLGYSVTSVADGLDAVDALREGIADLVLLDVMLPSLNGTSVTRRVREFSAVPIIIVSARGDDVDTVQGLDAGADDYVVKPVNLQVLDARIRALLRRGAPVSEVDTGREAGAHPAPGTGPGTAASATFPGPTARGDAGASAGSGAPNPSGPTPESAGEAPPIGLWVDARGLRAFLDGEPVHLTPTEWKLLLLLREARGSVVTREELLTRVWGGSWSQDARVLEVHVQRLRAKIGAERISTARGFGYRFHG